MSQTSIHLFPRHKQMVAEKCLNLSKFVRTKLDEEYGAGLGVSSELREKIAETAQKKKHSAPSRRAKPDD